MRTIKNAPAILAICFAGALLAAQQASQRPPNHAQQRTQGQPQPSKPKPDYQDVKYGPYERNVLDLWKAPSPRPTPVLVFFHGGGFRQGDKSMVSGRMIERCREVGISVAAANYRLSHQAPFPAPMLDSARAIQFLRYKAREWNLDVSRFAANGGSAGAGISLWIGFHDDMAKPASTDPVARQSTRLTCMTVVAAQSSYDRRFIKRVVGGHAYEHPALLPFWGLKPDEIDTPKAYRIYEQCSPINYLTRDDPPAFLFYGEDPGPVPADADPARGIHHPNFGIELKKKMDQLGIECIYRHKNDYIEEAGKPLSDDELNLRRLNEFMAFLLKHFKMSR